MNRVSKLAIAATFGTLSLAGISHAADGVAMNWPTQIDETLASYDQGFNVEHMTTLDDDESRTSYDNLPFPADSVQNIQAAISDNEPLLFRLNEQGVDLNDVLGATQAADGTVTFLVR